VKFMSVSGGQREIHLKHVFSTPVKGTVSVWLNDTAPGQETLYEGVTLYNSAQPKLVASVGTQDFDAFCYAATFVDSSGVSSGQNANCGIYPQLSTTNVRRTSGWHNLEARRRSLLR
jgi:hypothetical protein